MSNEFTLVADYPDFLVVDKAAGVNFHDEEDLGQGLFNRVKAELKQNELYPVHRLDKMTSGLVIFAKNLACTQVFQQMFAAHQVEKYYLALSDKKPNKKQGLIKGDMAKSRRGSWKLLRTTENPAISQFFSYALGSGKRLYVIKPHSGKTHQIRVALSSISAPILGDSHYYPQASGDRGYLHAYALRFTLKGEQFSFICPPSSGQEFVQTDFGNKLLDIGAPWLLNWPEL
ncbi:TIGR01621 family pseudouridine synthase [Thalassomonas haliotis]|uniref:TIGR01621 family pseudouridine synthase n=1 Tax=Thalassomonas haliotis TaxID=485448 RepID=A0ABY7VI71_9GAMM|nr:TIGR01621 family pseudouridine synthase [Thalassomonas haliotis]WDE12924.1 TIGR01621 family pseudouridine synthase [Thalassomonas haliotis]